MAGNFINPDFGVISSSVETNADIEAFLNGEDVTPIGSKQLSPKKDVKKATTKKVEDEEENEDEEVENTTPSPQLSVDEVFGSEDGEEDKKDEGEGEVDGKDEPKGSVFSDLTQEFLDLGIFKLDEDEDDLDISTPDQFVDRIHLEYKKGAGEVLDKFLSSAGEDARDMFESIWVKKVDPKTYLSTLVALKDVESIDITNEEGQVRVLREKLRQDGAKNIESKIERSIANGYIEEEASEAKEILVEREKTKLEQQKQDAERLQAQKQEAKNHYLGYVNKVISDKLRAKEFDGIPVTRQFAEQTLTYLTRDKYQAGNETLTQFDMDLIDLKKPANYELRVKMAMLLQKVKEDPTLSFIRPATINKDVRAPFSRLTGNKNTNTTDNNKDTEKKVTPWFSK